MTDPMTFHFNIGQIYEGISREILAVRYMYFVQHSGKTIEKHIEIFLQGLNGITGLQRFQKLKSGAT